MYKRRARVVFFAAATPCVAALARALAEHLDSQWLDVRAAFTGPAPHCPPATSDGLPLSAVPAALDESLLGWADLLVCLDAAALTACPALPPDVRRIHWPAVAAVAHLGVDDPTLRKALEERIQGMIGGMRLLAGLDGGSP
ncbi:MAG TPA: hypothetical protein VKA76_10545 [Gammaproteobacteria bacterium]|nr:hypothetical protein [Gammaproteobacteria bacterium]